MILALIHGLDVISLADPVESLDPAVRIGDVIAAGLKKREETDKARSEQLQAVWNWAVTAPKPEVKDTSPQ